MRVMVIGSGGREHALVWKLLQNSKIEKIYCVPGNAGIASIAECVPEISATDTSKLLNFASSKKIDFTVVGPEVPLSQGVTDAFQAQGLKIFGPTQEAAMLESSKIFAKNFMNRFKIPTAFSEAFEDKNSALDFIKKAGLPIVIKADGLAAGKGVVICQNFPEAETTLENMLDKQIFGEAGKQVLIEEFLRGEEVSIFAVSDGVHYQILAPAQDHKAIFDGDQGPNTGGMGAYAPAHIIDEKLMQEIQTTIIEPTITGMALENRPYRGLLYAGLILTKNGPKVLEYNCRFGDPETQAVLPLLKSDLLDLLIAASEGNLQNYQLEKHDLAAVCVIMAAGGYPGKYEKGQTILGLNRKFDENVYIFHAGTKKVKDKIVTDGGRVLGVTAWASDVADAIKTAYTAVGKIAFNGAYYRKDIAHKALI
ncbi:phosphoribosylamine--glycine ligase [candidate division KSB1 bacterium]|nr:phosphoribosylamine--glycine ligase [candidate division KSB1 bacterium]